MARQWTDDQLIEFYQKATSTHHLAKMLGLKRENKTLVKRAETLGLDLKSLNKKHERHTYDRDLLQEAVLSSTSIGQVLEKLGIVIGGGNYSTVKKRIKKYNLDTSHFSGQCWNKGKTLKKTSCNYFTKAGVKRKIIKDRSHQCEECHLTTWRDNLIPLELHHKDGDRTNNLEDNLQLLCPNCHALTKNYRGKNIKKSIAPAGSAPARPF